MSPPNGVNFVAAGAKFEDIDPIGNRKIASVWTQNTIIRFVHR